MDKQKHIKNNGPVKRLLYILTIIILVTALACITMINALSNDRVVPSDHCEGADCCISSDCLCPNCEGRGEPGGVCENCGGDLCENCGNCYNCGTSPCPMCRTSCYECGSLNLCGTCNGCLDCGYNRDPECPECSEETLVITDYYSETTIDDEPVPLFSAAGLDFFLFAPFGIPAWAILSLIFTIAGIVFSFFVIIRTARQKKEENKAFDERSAKLHSVNSLENMQLLGILESEERFIKQRRLWALVMTCFLSFSAVLFLVLMQDFEGIVVLFDWWVIIHSVLFAGVLICGKLVFKKYEFEKTPLYAPSSP